jgi:hypothetical protein
MFVVVPHAPAILPTGEEEFAPVITSTCNIALFQAVFVASWVILTVIACEVDTSAVYK